MRLLHTFTDQKQAETYAAFLTREGIENQLEFNTVDDWGSPNYGDRKFLIWIIDEDTVETAIKFLDKFLANPADPVFTQKSTPRPSLLNALNPLELGEKGGFPPQGPNAKPAPQNIGIVTLYLLITCTMLFVYGEFTQPTLTLPLPALPLLPLGSPEINKPLYYDYPEAYTIVDKMVSEFGIDKLKNPNDLPPEGKALYEQFVRTPFWEGYYDKIVIYLTQKKWTPNAPLFEKIREGEIWRIFTPAVLHLNIFHLFFNMLWLVILGKLIEDKLGPIRYILLFLIIAAVSNTAQYLMSGSNFIGISGVICGMLGFMWARRRLAAWEGYNIIPGVISFMFFFVLAMLGLQIAAFISQVYFNYHFIPEIANTAHIAGGLTGYLLGCLNVFAMRSK